MIEILFQFSETQVLYQDYSNEMCIVCVDEGLILSIRWMVFFSISWSQDLAGQFLNSKHRELLWYCWHTLLSSIPTVCHTKRFNAAEPPTCFDISSHCSQTIVFTLWPCQASRKLKHHTALHCPTKVQEVCSLLFDRTMKSGKVSKPCQF